MAEATMIVQLQSGDSQVMLCPEVGATIARFSWKTTDRLPAKPRKWSTSRQTR